jgi:hypothetical protein
MMNNELYQRYKVAWYEAEVKPQPKVARGVSHSVIPENHPLAQSYQQQDKCIKIKLHSPNDNATRR